MLRRAVESGVNLIDTADSYGPFVSERLIADALHPYPADLVIATKGGLLRDGPGRWRPDGRPQHLRAACETSLQRLKLEQILLYQLHRVDPRVSARGLGRHAGDAQGRGQDSPHRTVERRRGRTRRGARDHADRVGAEPLRAGTRDSEDLLDRCEQESLAFLPWAPLDQGNVEQNPELTRIAADHGATPRQVAVAWLLARSPVMLPIPGTGSLADLEENLSARSLVLTPSEIATLDRA